MQIILGWLSNFYHTILRGYQKLLYHCQAYHLAYFGKELLKEDFQAWVHGPVCSEIYHNFKGESVLYSDIKFKGDKKEIETYVKNYLTTDQFDLINELLKELSTWTGLQLETSTHQEKPWQSARIGYGEADICNEIISKDSMKEFYKKFVNG